MPPSAGVDPEVDLRKDLGEMEQRREEGVRPRAWSQEQKTGGLLCWGKEDSGAGVRE